MLNFLKQPYPFPERTPLQHLLTSIAEGIFVGLFLIVFQPFGATSLDHPQKIWFLAGFGVITMLCGLFMRFVVRGLAPRYFQEEHWTVGREIVVVSAIILLIALTNYLYNMWFFEIPFSLVYFLWSSVFVLVVGIFPISFGIFANYIYKLKKYSQPVIVVAHTPAPQTELRLVAENGKDIVSVPTASLLCIESADNYSVIFSLAEGHQHKRLIRGSLSRLEGQIFHERIVRCHRSYIVNLDQVERVSGNAQGYKFHLRGTDLVIPVARRYSELIEQLR